MIRKFSGSERRISKQQNNKQNKNKNKRSMSIWSDRAMNPPNWEQNLKVHRKIRFMANASSSANGTSITVDSLCGTMAMAVSATVAYALPLAIRLREIEIWAGPTSTTTGPVSVFARYPAGAFSGISNPEVTHSDTSIGATMPAHVRSRPPRNSIASQWVSGDLNSTLVQVNCPQYAVVDITYDAVLPFVVPTIAPFSYTIVGATSGDLYCLAADALPSTGILIPVGLNTAS